MTLAGDRAPVGVLLAGGAGQRMDGVEKGLLPLGPGRLCDGPLQALTESCGSVLVAAGPMPQTPEGVARADRLRAALPGHRLVWDAPDSHGPLAGIAAALRAGNGAPVVVVAWDMPCVTAPLLQTLIRALPPHAACAMPELVPGHREPLCAVYAARCLPVIESLGRAARAGPRDLPELAGGITLGAAHFAHLGDVTPMFTSIDTPAALDAVRRRRAG